MTPLSWGMPRKLIPFSQGGDKTPHFELTRFAMMVNDTNKHCQPNRMHLRLTIGCSLLVMPSKRYHRSMLMSAVGVLLLDIHSCITPTHSHMYACLDQAMLVLCEQRRAQSANTGENACNTWVNVLHVGAHLGPITIDIGPRCQQKLFYITAAVFNSMWKSVLALQAALGCQILQVCCTFLPQSSLSTMPSHITR